MKKLFTGITFVAFAAIIGLSACKHDGNNSGTEERGKADGAREGIVLLLADADLIQVDGNPQYNTAEWIFSVDKPGRYDIWLSTLTKDTLQLQFEDNVVITAGETRVAKKPIRDQIVTEDKSVKEPWFRADSHMGSVFFPKPGEYPVQVISDKVEPHGADISQLSTEENIHINSVILKPKGR